MEEMKVDQEFLRRWQVPVEFVEQVLSRQVLGLERIQEQMQDSVMKMLQPYRQAMETWERFREHLNEPLEHLARVAEHLKAPVEGLSKMYAELTIDPDVVSIEGKPLPWVIVTVLDLRDAVEGLRKNMENLERAVRVALEGISGLLDKREE